LEFDNGHLRDDYDTAKARLDKLRATVADEPSHDEADEMLRIHLEIWNAIKQKVHPTIHAIVKHTDQESGFLQWRNVGPD
jgi:hypothetical protein